jgi:HEAT repeat protein
MEAAKRLCSRPTLKTESIDLLVGILAHENREVRKHLIRDLGPARAPGIDERLLHAIRSDSPLRTLSYTYGEGKRRSMPAAAASMLKRRADKAIPATIASLESDDLELLRYASRAVGAYGPKAIAAIPRLRALAAHPDSAVRKNALRSLGQIGGDE